MRVWKFELPKPTSRIEMPVGARVVKAGVQTVNEDSMIVLWAIVDEDGEREERVFHAFNTGNPLPGDLEYVGTVESVTGVVWHVFEDRS